MHHETRPGRNAIAVCIQFGPFTGFKGIVVSTRLERVTVHIILRQRRPILVELDAEMIKRCDDGDALNPPTTNTAERLPCARGCTVSSNSYPVPSTEERRNSCPFRGALSWQRAPPDRSKPAEGIRGRTQ